MKIAVFSTKRYDRAYLQRANAAHGHHLTFFEAHLNPRTARLAEGCSAACVFVNDTVNAEVVGELAQCGIRLVALRCAGYNNVDLPTAEKNGVVVVRVPAYSPHAVAEHTVALLLALNRKIYRAYNRIREGNFALEGLLGFDLHGKTIGLIGTGRIGARVASIMNGFGCQLLGYDLSENDDCLAVGLRYVSLPELYEASDVITLHCPLTPNTHHLINRSSLEQMKQGVTIINTSRGALIDTRDVIQALKSGKIGYLGMDVYEEEADLFFEDLSAKIIQDDVFSRLITFPNVVITGHQAFFTSHALEKIAHTTLNNITAEERGEVCPHRVVSQSVKGQGAR